jgi:hypothetical protein
MEFFSDNLCLWLALLLPAAAVLGLDARRSSRGSVNASALRSALIGLASLAALVGGFCLACGLIHVACSWAVDQLVSARIPMMGY